MRTISGGESCNALATSLIIRDGRCSRSKKGGGGRLWSLISWIDQLYGESTYMPSCLGLDDQFYRLLALSLLETAGKAEAIAQHWTPAATSWSSPLDDLVDYIRTNSHLKLTLTDLEQNSGYSARHLQVLFKDKFDCTPMQFVRRQRLSAAMQKLQIADWESSVTTIARDCGYRYTSQFSSDFLKEFGVKPSTVLRSTRR